MPILFLGEEQDAGGALDGGRVKAGGADAHHGAAQNDLPGGLYKAAALLGNVLEGSAHAGQAVDGSLQGAAAVGDDTLNNALAFVAGLVDGVAGTGADHVAAHAGGQPAGLHLTAGDGLDLHLLAALGVLDLFGDDLNAVLGGIEGVEQIDGVLLVDLDTVIGLLHAVGDTHQLNALEQLGGEIQHGQVVAVQIRLALGAVDNQLIHLADTAADLHSGGEHGAAHADHTGLTDALQNGLRVLQLLLREGGHQFRGILEVILNDHRHDHIPQGVRSGLNGNDLAGDGGMDRGRDRNRVFTDLLIHLHIVAYLNQGLAGRAYVLYHGDHYLRRRCDDGHGDFRGLHVIGVHAAFKSMGHKLHLFKICRSLTSKNCITTGHILSIIFDIKKVVFTGQVSNNPVR